MVADATDFPLLAFSSFAQWAVDEREDCRLAEEFFKKCLAIPPRAIPTADSPSLFLREAGGW